MHCTSERLRSLRTVGAHCLREVIAQPPAKLAGLATLCATAGAWSSGDETIATGLLIGATAAAGVLVVGRIACHQFGTTTARNKAAVALSAAAGGGLAAACAIGNEAAVMATESMVAVSAIALCAARVVAARSREEVPPWINAGCVLAAAAAGVMAFCAFTIAVPRGSRAIHMGGGPDGFLLARQAGSLVEALAVEIGKELLSGCGPSVDRRGLTFDDRIKAAAQGLLPYTAACVLINGMAAPALLANGDGVSQDVVFEDLVAAVLVTCLTNVLRNGVNAAVVIHTWDGGKRDGLPDNPIDYQAEPKTMLGRAATIVDRWAVRSLLMAARTATYVFMRTQGFSIEASAMVAQGKYAVFAQFREVLADLMVGDGWSPQVLVHLRETDPPSRIDLEEIEAQFDAQAVELEFERVLQQAGATA
ncbi:hypothetical protein [Caenimonas koreensis]|uniref:hypothetical protein n=1 Tax=Caenimonas koreensis TaxID=367474 RepID=UPI003784444B